MAGHDKITPQGKKFFSQMAELKKLQVRVGFQYGEAFDDGTGEDIADVAARNEFGTKNIPSRPFLRQSVDNNEGKINAMCKAQLRTVVKGERSAKQLLETIGLTQKALIQNEIRTGSFVPNAESTVSRKGSSKPLIDSGRMMQSVNFTIMPKGK